MERKASIYLHYPCFDGVISAAIATDYLESRHGWHIEACEFVNYNRQRTWLQERLAPRSAVVDFLYHPDAAFWADHHGTTFLTARGREEFEELRAARPLIYDRDSPSCAMLLWTHYGDHSTDRERFGEMAYWANKIDGAQYASVDEAVRGSSPAASINLALTVDGDPAFGELLLRCLRTMSLSELAELPAVRKRAREANVRVRHGLAAVKRSIRVEHGSVAIFDVAPRNGQIVNRYSAYYFVPDARYSVALVRDASGAKITAMRNPWREFESIDLGALFRKYGGGGHQRVASVVLPASRSDDPALVLRDISSEVSRLDREAEVAAKVPA